MHIIKNKISPVLLWSDWDWGICFSDYITSISNRVFGTHISSWRFYWTFSSKWGLMTSFNLTSPTFGADGLHIAKCAVIFFCLILTPVPYSLKYYDLGLKLPTPLELWSELSLRGKKNPVTFIPSISVNKLKIYITSILFVPITS